MSQGWFVKGKMNHNGENGGNKLDGNWKWKIDRYPGKILGNSGEQSINQIHRFHRLEMQTNRTVFSPTLDIFQTKNRFLEFLPFYVFYEVFFFFVVQCWTLSKFFCVNSLNKFIWFFYLTTLNFTKIIGIFTFIYTP